MTMYQKKLAADIRCPLEYGLSVFWRQMEIAYYMRTGTKQ